MRIVSAVLYYGILGAGWYSIYLANKFYGLWACLGTAAAFFLVMKLVDKLFRRFLLIRNQERPEIDPNDGYSIEGMCKTTKDELEGEQR